MLAIVFGTRPEVIKLSPVINALRYANINFTTIFTSQHNELFDDVKDLIPDPDIILDIDKAEFTGHENYIKIVQEKLIPIFNQLKPSLVIIQGDTATTYASAIVANQMNIPIGHIEAGLRTYDLNNPYPEEGFRQHISQLATLHWAPTQIAFNNLKEEGHSNIKLTGNTIVDVCHLYNYEVEYQNKVLVTIHRKENLGSKLIQLFKEIEQLAITNPDIEFIFPMHPNPEIQKYKHIFDKVSIISPKPYDKMLKLLSIVKFVISDSGGLQEECAFFKKKILVCRKITERPEGIDVGLARIVDTEISKHFDWANQQPVWYGDNPYGNGQAHKLIIDDILNFLDLSQP